MPQSVVDNLLRSVELHGHRCALDVDDKTFSYEALLKNAEAVAGFLSNNGVRAGDRVGLVLPNGAEYVAAYYGVLMANAIVVPMNAEAKAKDIGAWIAHCEPAWLFADARNAEVEAALAVGGAEVQLVTIGQGNGQITFADIVESGGKPMGSRPSPKQSAAILYTSGTTGRPKGVLLSHDNLASNARSIISYLGLSAEDRSVTVLPFTYAYGNSILHSHLGASARLTLEPNLLYPHMVVQTLVNSRATGFAGVPSTFALLLARVKLSQFDLTGLRYVTQAGGAMSPAMTARLRAALPDVDVVVMYGQTEATARLTYLPPSDLQRKTGSVGIPIPDVRIEVRGDDRSPLSSRCIGDVWAAGPNIMVGYWRDDDATSSVIVDGWLKTGDMGYLDEDGYLFLTGRRSDIIKVGAHRIHPLEVEEVLAEIPGVLEVAVVGVEDEMLGQVIRALIVGDGVAKLDVMRVKSYCRDKLASYKIPRVVDFVTALPKTASGKILRTELTPGAIREYK